MAGWRTRIGDSPPVSVAGAAAETAVPATAQALGSPSRRPANDNQPGAADEAKEDRVVKAREADEKYGYDEGDKKPDKKEGDKSGGKDKEEDKKGGGGGDGKKPKRRWPLVVLAIVVVLAIIGGVIYWFLTRNEVTTDDAYTEGNAVSVAPKVAGYVVQRNVDDNAFVKAGDLLLRIDPRDYLTARDQARANLDLARAELSSAEVALEIERVRAPATLVQAQASLTQSRANQINAEREYKRQRSVDPRATTLNNVDTANAQLRAQTAGVNSAQAQVSIASLVQQNIKAAEDTVEQRRAQVEQAEANLAQAEVNLSYTELHAPQDGFITRRNFDLGTYLQAGQQAFYLVAPYTWVVANFKETQLEGMRPGQKVQFDVDAYPNLKLTGHIDSIMQGSGARFSTFPAENATGNFVKIVRRVPVKMVIDNGIDQARGLPLGLSVVPTVTLR